MELYIDLLRERRKKSFFRIIFGIFICLFGSTRFFVTETMTPFDWIYFGGFTLIGIVHLIEGLGYPIKSFFGEAYLLINSELIVLKASVWNKKQFVKWNDVKSINYKLNKFEFEKTDGSIMHFDLFEFNYRLIIEVKQTINSIAKEKNIHYNL